MKLIVLGGGPAGMNAALQARELHAEVTLIESKRVGGTSVNEGPTPVRTLAGPRGWPAMQVPGRLLDYGERALKSTWPRC